MSKYSEWKPASGYKNRWRVVKTSSTALPSVIELETGDGKRRRTFKTIESAQKFADKLNTQKP